MQLTLYTNRNKTECNKYG